ncbi:MAG: hypothetical protein ACRCZF_02775 [Gemmataceae bacterium]
MQFRLLMSAIVLCGLNTVASAQVIYSNLTTFSGSGYDHGGATSTITRMVGDDINVAPAFANTQVTSFTFSVVNFNPVAVSAAPLVRFYAIDPTTGSPTTLLGAYDFAPISIPGGSVIPVSTSIVGEEFTVPSNSTFWAAVTFDSTGTSTTTAQLNLLGQGLFNPPTVGTSGDVFFETTNPGSFAASNPTPFDLLFFCGTPVANFGWEFDITPVPEPATTTGLVIGATALVGGFRRYRRRNTATEAVAVPA